MTGTEKHDLEWSSQAPGTARRALHAALARWGIDGIQGDDACLVVSELVTNAYIHGCPPLSTEFCVVEDGAGVPTALRIEVRDSEVERHPMPRSPAATDESGRGMALVSACVSRWGCDVDGDVKVVWAEIDLDPRPAPPTS